MRCETTTSVEQILTIWLSFYIQEQKKLSTVESVLQKKNGHLMLLSKAIIAAGLHSIMLTPREILMLKTEG